MERLEKKEKKTESCHTPYERGTGEKLALRKSQPAAAVGREGGAKPPSLRLTNAQSLWVQTEDGSASSGKKELSGQEVWLGVETL